MRGGRWVSGVGVALPEGRGGGGGGGGGRSGGECEGGGGRSGCRGLRAAAVGVALQGLRGGRGVVAGQSARACYWRFVTAQAGVRSQGGGFLGRARRSKLVSLPVLLAAGDGRVIGRPGAAVGLGVHPVPLQKVWRAVDGAFAGLVRVEGHRDPAGAAVVLAGQGELGARKGAPRDAAVGRVALVSPPLGWWVARVVFADYASGNALVEVDGRPLGFWGEAEKHDLQRLL